ncbi:tail completion protein gp17 [Aquamicrobium ahrensii]|uniref:DUF3168 domain-containing protein n=1 Tax=Aquamicrobium ahrensii TaxID=469551 RepID=A0ABV2KPG5_9HYPH
MEQELTALLTSAAPRRFWGRAPQTPAPARPYITLSRVSGVRRYHNQGADDLVASRVQIDVYGDTYVSAQNTGNAVIAVLSGYHGGTLQGVFIDSQRDLSGIDGSDPNELFRMSIDVIVRHAG